MNVTEYFAYLKNRAIEYVAQGDASVIRNRHMNELAETASVAPEVIEAVVADFINHIAANHGIDYALYTSDINALRKKAQPKQEEPEEDDDKQLGCWVCGNNRFSNTLTTLSDEHGTRTVWLCPQHHDQLVTP